MTDHFTDKGLNSQQKLNRSMSVLHDLRSVETEESLCMHCEQVEVMWW